MQSGDRAIPGFLSLPPSKPTGKWPGLLIFHGTDGLGPQHLEFVTALIQKGYACLLPQWFGGISSRARAIESDPIAACDPIAAWSDLEPDDLQVFWQTLRNDFRIDENRCALLGFSRGGGLALLAASRLPGVKGVVNFFGLTAWADGYADYRNFNFLSKDNYLSFLKHITCPILTMHGESDTVVPAANSYKLEKICQEYKLTADFHYYPGVEHSFIWPGNIKFNAAANQQTRSLMFNFLEVTLLASAR